LWHPNASGQVSFEGARLKVANVVGISYTHEKKDIDMGPLQVTQKETRTVPISPIASTVAVVAGVVLVIVGSRKGA
jgi:hypothetical protein